MKSLTEAQRQAGAAEQTLEAPHQIAVPDQPQVSLLGKTNTYSQSNHSSDFSRHCRCRRET
jgi:hypothetical protein